MNNPQHIRIQDYSYSLPEERIAKYPVAKRDESKLLIYNKGSISHDVFKNITRYLTPGSLLVYNNTKVIQARVHFHKDTGALIEVFLLEPHTPRDYEQIFQARSECSWVCLVGNLKKWKTGVLTRTIDVGGQDIQLSVEREGEESTGHVIRFSWSGGVGFSEILDAVGELPIPPYLNRKTEDSDKTTYQTVYSKIKGSVAAPTAGLHFTDAVLADVEAHGIEREEVTLHVGAGTFKPVKSEEIAGHEMHREYITVHRSTIEKIIAHDCRVTAVGTTSVRTLESLYYIGCKLLADPDLDEEQMAISNQWMPYEDNNFVGCDSGATNEDALRAILAWMDRHETNILNTSTKIIIAPGYEYHIVEKLITNFHQPKSTLLLLVSALIGDDWHRVYDYALGNDFRFLSYGDSSLLIPPPTPPKEEG